MVRTAPAEISRCQFLAAGGVTVAVACLVPRGLCAQTDDLVEHALKEATTAKVTVQTLRRNISVLYGAGGNVAVLIGPDGKLIVDSEIVSSRTNVSAGLMSINADPVKQLINTHWHFDHTGANEWLREAGASILAQENTRRPFERDARRRLPSDSVKAAQVVLCLAASDSLPAHLLPGSDDVQYALTSRSDRRGRWRSASRRQRFGTSPALRF